MTTAPRSAPAETNRRRRSASRQGAASTLPLRYTLLAGSLVILFVLGSAQTMVWLVDEEARERTLADFNRWCVAHTWVGVPAVPQPPPAAPDGPAAPGTDSESDPRPAAKAGAAPVPAHRSAWETAPLAVHRVAPPGVPVPVPATGWQPDHRIAAAPAGPFLPEVASLPGRFTPLASSVAPRSGTGASAPALLAAPALPAANAPFPTAPVNSPARSLALAVVQRRVDAPTTNGIVPTESSYVGASGFAYATASNWNPAVVPDDNNGGNYNVTIATTTPTIGGAPVTIDNLTITAPAVNADGTANPPTQLIDTTLTVTGQTQLNALAVTASNTDATARLGTSDGGALNLAATAGHTATVEYTGAHISVNAGTLTFSGPGTTRVIDENGLNAFRDFYFNQGTLNVSDGNTFSRRDSSGNFDPNNPFQNYDGKINVTSSGTTATRLELGYTSSLGSVTLSAPLPGSSATIELAGTLPTANFGTLSLTGAGARFVDGSGQNALRNVAANDGTIAVADGQSLTLAGGFANDGALRVTTTGVQGETQTRLIINGTLANIGAGGVAGALAPGMFTMPTSYEIRSTANPAQTATLQITGADITSISQNGFHGQAATSVLLAGPGANIVDEQGRDALRNLSLLDGGSLEVADGHNFTTAGNFTNNGRLIVSAAPGTSTTFAVSGALTNLTGTTLAPNFNGSDNDDSTYLVEGRLGGTVMGVPTFGNATLQIANANIVHNQAVLILSGPGARVTDQNGLNALRNFANNSFGTFDVSSGQAFTTGGNFSNGIAGHIIVDSSVSGANSRFTVNGSLQELQGTELTDPGSGGSSYTITARNGGTATLRANGANIVTNDATLTLTGAAANIVDEQGRDALRNLAVNNGTLSLLEGHNLTTAGNFTNTSNVTVAPTGSLDDPRRSFTPLPNAVINPDSGLPVATALTINGNFVTSDNNQFIATGTTGVSLLSYGGVATAITVNGNLTNTGTITEAALGAKSTAAFTVKGTLTNFDPATRTLTGGGYFFTSSNGAIPTFQFTGADIVTNNAFLRFDDYGNRTLQGDSAGPIIMDQNGQDGLRHLAANGPGGVLQLNLASFTTPGGFTNQGEVDLNPVAFAQASGQNPAVLVVSGDFANSGTVSLANRSSLSLQAPGNAPATFTNTGIVRLGFTSGVSNSLPAFNGTAASATLSATNYMQSAGTSYVAGTLGANTYTQTGGALLLYSGFSGSGQVSATTLNFQGGEVRGSGLLDGNVTSNVRFAPSVLDVVTGDVAQEGGQLNVSGSLSLGEASILDISVGTPDQTSLVAVDGAVTLGGKLRLTLNGGFVPTADDVFTLVTGAGGLTGALANVADGGRLATAGGEGTFQVNYGSGANTDALVISDFMAVPVPEPGTVALLGIGVAGGYAVTRRRRCVRD